VYELVDEAPPKSFHEAAERGDTTYIIKVIERTIDFDINQQVRVGGDDSSHERALQGAVGLLFYLHVARGAGAFCCIANGRRQRYACMMHFVGMIEHASSTLVCVWMSQP
jgi:hypothetical protein